MDCKWCKEKVENESMAFYIRHDFCEKCVGSVKDCAKLAFRFHKVHKTKERHEMVGFVRRNFPGRDSVAKFMKHYRWYLAEEIKKGLYD